MARILNTLGDTFGSNWILHSDLNWIQSHMTKRCTNNVKRKMNIPLVNRSLLRYVYKQRLTRKHVHILFRQMGLIKCSYKFVRLPQC